MKSDSKGLTLDEIRKRYESEPYINIRKEISKTQKDWMGVEPFDSLTFEDRLHFNRLDYINNFYPDNYEFLFKENIFLDDMLEIYKDVKHPILKSYKSFLNNKLLENKERKPENELNMLPDIDLTTQKEQIRLLYDLGVINFLVKKYPKTLKNNNSQFAILISKILKENNTSIQPSLSALLNDNGNKNYPKETKRTKAIMDKLKSNESI